MKNLFLFLFVLASPIWAAPERVELIVQTGWEVAGVLSPDGRFRAAPDVAGTGVWDVASGELRRVFPGTGESAWSPDGRFLAVAGEGIRIWQMPQGTLVRFEKRGWRRVSWDGQGKRFITLVNDRWERGAFAVFDRDNPKWTRPIPTQLRSEGQSDAPQLSPDGKRALVWDESYSSDDKPRLRAQLWNVDTGKVEREFSSAPEVRTARFSPDGQLLALGLNSHTLVLWNLRDGSQRTLLNGPSGGAAILSVDQLAFSPDGRELVAQTDDYRFRVWNVESRRQVRVLPPSLWGKILDFNRFDQRGAVVSSDGTVVTRLPAAPLQISTLAWARNSQTLVHDGGGRLRVWDWKAGELLCAPPVLGAVSRLGLGSSALAATLEVGDRDDSRTELWRWNLPLGRFESNRRLSTPPSSPEERENRPRDFSPDGTLAAWDEGRGWAIREVATRKLVRLIAPPKRAERFLFLSGSAALTIEDGPNTGGGTCPTWVRRWNLKSGASRLVFAGEAPLWDWNDFLIASPSGRFVAGTRDKRGRIWSVDNGWKSFPLAREAQWSSYDPTVSGWGALAWSRDEKWLATFDGATIALRPLAPDGRPGKAVLVGVAGLGSSGALAFSPDGRFLASSGRDGTVKIWSIARALKNQNALEVTIFNFPDTLADATPQWLALAPDGRWTSSPGAEQWAKWRRVGASLTQPLLPLESQRARRDANLLRFGR